MEAPIHLVCRKRQAQAELRDLNCEERVAFDISSLSGTVVFVLGPATSTRPDRATARMPSDFADHTLDVPHIKGLLALKDSNLL